LDCGSGARPPHFCAEVSRIGLTPWPRCASFEKSAGGKRMLMLFTGIAIGFLLSTAVFASMARVDTH
jgi:hypothetical protein